MHPVSSQLKNAAGFASHNAVSVWPGKIIEGEKAPAGISYAPLTPDAASPHAALLRAEPMMRKGGWEP